MKLLVLVMWLSGCGELRTYAPRRGDITGADPGLARLEVDVSTSNPPGEPLTVHVLLSDPKQFIVPDHPKPDACFQVTDDYRVLVDGQPAKLVFGGGPTTEGTISGQVKLPSTCGPAQFEWIAPGPGAPGTQTRITIEHGTGRAEMTVADLTTPRTLRMSPASPRPGDQVTLDWSPHGDEWSGNVLDASVHIYQPDEFSIDAPVEVDGSRLRFTMPAVRPGPALLDLYMPNRDAHPVIQRCVGVDRCATGGAITPPTVKLVIAAS